CTIEVPQCEVLDSLFAPEHIAVQRGAPIPRPAGNRHAWKAPHNTYRVQGDDAWIAIAAGDDREFTALCDVLGLQALASDARFARASDGKEHEAARHGGIAEATQSWDGEGLQSKPQAVGVEVCRVAKGWLLPG